MTLTRNLERPFHQLKKRAPPLSGSDSNPASVIIKGFWIDAYELDRDPCTEGFVDPRRHLERPFSTHSGHFSRSTAQRVPSVRNGWKADATRFSAA
jgi:hypothetical protein